MRTGLASLDRSRLRVPLGVEAPALAGLALRRDGFAAAVAHEPALEVTAPGLRQHLVVVALSERRSCEGEVKGRGLRLDYRIGATVVLPAGTASCWRHRQPGRMVHLLFDATRFEAVFQSASEPVPEFDSLVLTLDVEFLRIARAVACEAASPGPATRLFVDQLRLAMAVRLARLGRGAPRPDSSMLRGGRLDRAMARLEDCLAEDVSLSDLAAAADMSPFHFARAFKASTGVPPHRYLMQRRIERAQAMLASTKQSVTAIAIACGFASSQHMATVFRRAVGVTPTAYRRERMR